MPPEGLSLPGNRFFWREIESKNFNRKKSVLSGGVKNVTQKHDPVDSTSDRHAPHDDPYSVWTIKFAP